MGISQRKPLMAIKAEGKTQKVDKLILMINQSSEWMNEYDKFDELEKNDLHFGVSQKIEELVQKNDIKKFTNLYEIIRQLNDRDKNKTLLKRINYFILACKYNRLEMLKHLLNDATKNSFNFSTAIERNNFISNNLFEVNKAGNTAFYYAIRSNNVDLLETLIESVDEEPTILYDLLCNDYASLKSKNVYIHETMQIFVEDRLVRERFLRDFVDASTSTSKKKSNTSRPEVEIYKRLKLMLVAVKQFNEISSQSYVQNPRINIALLIARNIRMLKGQLKSTYSHLPWEEVEFFLSRYAYLHPVVRKKLHRYLNKFVDKLKSFFCINDDSNENETKVYEEIAKYGNGTVLINREKIEDFKDLYDDYELMKDDYSLDKMMRYIQLALSVDPKNQSGRLIIQRALHVIGEFVKNSPASPNLSQSTQENFYSNDMGVCMEVAPSLRDTLSHIEELHSLFLRDSIENEESFFTKLQEDLKRAISVVVHVSCCVKAKYYKKWCQNIINENNPRIFEEECQGFIDYLRRNKLPDVEAPELNGLNEAENLLTVLKIIIFENEEQSMNFNVLAKIDEIEKIVGFEKNSMAKRIKKFNNTFETMETKVRGHLYKISQLDKRGDDKSDEISVKESSKMFFKYVFYNIDIPLNNGGLKRMHEIDKLIDQIMDDVKVIPRYEEIFMLIAEIRNSLSRKSYSLIFKTLEEYKEKLDLSETELSTSENIKMELDEVFKGFKSELGSEELFRKVQSLIEKKKVIHRIKLKIDGCYEKNKDQLTLDEVSVINEELRSKRVEGKKLLGKTVDFYGEFLAGKREFHKFAGAIRLKKKEDTARLIEIFNSIKSQSDDHDPESIFNETIRQFQVESTIEKYDDLVKKLNTVKEDHKARLSLTSFFDCMSELDKKTYEQLVDSLNTTPKTRTDFEKLYKFSNTSYVAKSLNDSYGILLNVIGNKKSATDKICNAYVNFLDALQLESNTTKLLRRTIIKSKILTILDKQLSVKLNLLKDILGKVKTWDSKFIIISRYREDEELQAVVEMILFDLFNLSTLAATLFTKFMGTNSGYPLKFLERGFLYLDGNLPFLKDNSLRNYLTHGDALIDALPFDPSIAVISSAILISEEAESLIALKDLLNNENMSKHLMNQMKKSPKQLLPESFPSDAQFDFDSLRQFQKSNYWKYYLKTMHRNQLEEVDSLSLYDLNLNQFISQASLFTVVSKGDKRNFESLVASGEEIHSREFDMQSLLHIAANEGHNDIVEALLNEGIVIDARDREKNTSMSVAACNGHGLVVETLLKRGAHVHTKNMSGRTALHEAAIMGHVEVADVLLKYGADCNVSSDSDSTPLHNAAWRGNLKIIKLLIEDYKAKIDVEDHLGNRPLHMAAKGLHNSTEVFDYLLTKDPASINCKNKSDSTPLDLAVITGNENGVETLLSNGGIDINENHQELLLTAVLYGHVKIVQLLREKGIDVNDVSWSGCSTALHIAARNGHSQLVKYLIQEKYPVDTKTDIGITPLHLAVQSGDCDTVKVLVEIGKTDPNTTDENGWTPLHVAVFYNHLTIVKYLVGMNADPEAVDFVGQSLLHRWASNGNSDLSVADYLINDLRLMSMLDVRDDVGRTPLEYATHIATISVIEYFVNKKARLDVRDKNGATLLHLAVDRGNLDLVKYFISKIGDKIDRVIYAADDGGNNVLHAAVKLGHTNIVNTLLQTRNDDAFVNCYNNHQFTPLFCAVLKGNTNIVEALLKNGACSNSWKNRECSPLQLAVAFDFKNIVKMLLDKEADPNRLIIDKSPPLFYAVVRNQQEIVTMLLDAGANVNFTTNDGMTVLHVAVKLNHYDIVKLLVTRGADINALDENQSTPLNYAIDKCDLKMHLILVMTIPEALIQQLKGESLK